MRSVLEIAWNSVNVTRESHARQPRSTSHFSFTTMPGRCPSESSNSEAARTPSLSYESAEFSHEARTCLERRATLYFSTRIRGFGVNGT